MVEDNGEDRYGTQTVDFRTIGEGGSIQAQGARMCRRKDECRMTN
jgi:hypothetical protein